MSVKTPVALFVFNRPEHTRQVLQALALVRPSTLLVVADGPRSDHPDDIVLCAQVREAVDNLPWQCEVKRNISDRNMGCRLRVSSGLDWVFGMVDEAIILEDDTVPDPSFFPFCEEMLQRHRNDGRVQLVRGSSLLPTNYSLTSSYYFSKWYGIWGWASWSRAWERYDLEMKAWPVLGRSWLRDYLKDPEMTQVFAYLFDEMKASRINSWEFPLFFNGWLHDAVAVAPSCNLIRNIGFGPEATHLRNAGSAVANLATEPMNFPLVHPDGLFVDEDADRVEWAISYNGLKRKLSAKNRLIRKLRSITGL